MSELACTCGGCQLEPIDECRCPFAARMRQQVKQLLSTYDLSNDDARATAYAAVTGAFVDEYGKQVLRHRSESASLVAPIALALGGLVAIVAIVLLVIRSRGAVAS